MAKPRLTYFDAPVSRGEECRLALHVAGIEFEDHRVNREQWVALKPTSPFGSLPILELPGHPPLGQTNAILGLIGRRHSLHPASDFEAARHEAVMEHVEDLRARVGVTMRMTDADEKRRAREDLASSYLADWATSTERQISDDGPFFGGAAIQVVDLKLLMTVRWFRGGSLDHIPTTVFAGYPKLNRVHDAVEAHPAVRAWYARR
jgi:glutathione S-transferase